MRYETISRERRTDLPDVYCIVALIDGVPESFEIHRKPLGNRIVTDERGHWKLIDGTFVAPGSLDPYDPRVVREDFLVDIKAEIVKVIERKVRRKMADQSLPLSVNLPAGRVPILMQPVSRDVT